MPNSSHSLQSIPRRGRREGAILILVAMLMLSLVGMLGLVIDTGIMMAQVRHVQGVADAAALAAARDLLAGRTASEATATAQQFVAQYNGITALNGGDVYIPPQSGAYAGAVGFVEVSLRHNLNTYFIQVLPGIDGIQQVAARAVAGYEPVSAGEGVAVLNPTHTPGLGVSGGAIIQVNGRVVVNSEGSGVDENNVVVESALNQPAASVSNNSTLRARNIRVVGGVNNPANFQNYDPAGGSPLRARQLPEPDPLVNLTIPISGVDGNFSTVRGIVNNSSVGTGNFVATGYENDLPYPVAEGDYVLRPGVYEDIRLQGGRTWFLPGIYVLKATGNNQGLRISNNAQVVGRGVMFYVTGGTYEPTTGLPDSGDGDSVGNITASMSQFSITGGQSEFLPISRSRNGAAGTSYVDERFDGMLIFQRRWNSESLTIAGNSTEVLLAGTLYARSANVSISGQGQYNAQFIVGSLSASGSGVITILSAGSNVGRANQIFLVE